MPVTSPRSHCIMDLLLRSKNPFEGEPGGGGKAFQEISSSTGRKIHQKLMEAPMANLCLLTKEQLFWPGGRTIASRSFQRLQTQDSEPLALLLGISTSARNTTINLLWNMELCCARKGHRWAGILSFNTTLPLLCDLRHSSGLSNPSFQEKS